MGRGHIQVSSILQAIIVVHQTCWCWTGAGQGLTWPHGSFWRLGLRWSASKWVRYLNGHPDRDFVDYIVHGLKEGFRVGLITFSTTVRRQNKIWRQLGSGEGLLAKRR